MKYFNEILKNVFFKLFFFLVRYIKSLLDGYTDFIPDKQLLIFNFWSWYKKVILYTYDG